MTQEQHIRSDEDGPTAASVADRELTETWEGYSVEVLHALQES